MISWPTIAYGAVLSGLLAAVLISVAGGERRPAVLALAAGTAAVAAAAWNAVLHATRASRFFTDAPVPLFPVSWQDTGSGVWVLPALELVLSLGPCAARRHGGQHRYACTQSDPELIHREVRTRRLGTHGALQLGADYGL